MILFLFFSKNVQSSLLNYKNYAKENLLSSIIFYKTLNSSLFFWLIKYSRSAQNLAFFLISIIIYIHIHYLLITRAKSEKLNCMWTFRT